MDAILMIALFVLFSVVSDRLDKKKRPPKPGKKSKRELPRQLPAQWPRHPVPTSQDEPLPFAIPELRNAPSPAGEACQETVAIRQQEKKEKEESRNLLKEQYQQADERQRKEQEQQIPAVKPLPQPVHPVNRWIPMLTPQSAQQAVVLAEILGRPKAYRR